MSAAGHEALTRYLQEFQKVASRCSRFIDSNRPKPLLESFIHGLKPHALKNKVLDEFKLNLIQDLETLISRTLDINNTLVTDEPRNKQQNFQRKPNYTNSRPTNFRPSNFRSPNANLRNKVSSIEKKNCSFCKKDGHLIEDCFDKTCKKSKHYDPSAPQTKKPYTNPRLPKPTFGNAKRTTRSSKNNFVTSREQCSESPHSLILSDDEPIEFDLELPKLLSNTFLLTNPRKPMPKASAETIDDPLPVSVSQELSSSVKELSPITGSGFDPFLPVRDTPQRDVDSNVNAVVNKSNQGPSKLLSLKVLVNNTPFEALIDSACETSCFSEDIAKKAGCQIVASRFKCTLANGTNIQSNGTANCILSFEFDRILSPLVHMKCQIPIILGRKPIPNWMRLIVKPRSTKRKFTDDQSEQRTLQDHRSRSYSGPPNGRPPPGKASSLQRAQH
ncbi:hypothetical protein GEMRC1_005038 [Eukaryota sp. GEM-RC1]